MRSTSIASSRIGGGSVGGEGGEVGGLFVVMDVHWIDKAIWTIMLAAANGASRSMRPAWLPFNLSWTSSRTVLNPSEQLDTGNYSKRLLGANEMSLSRPPWVSHSTETLYPKALDNTHRLHHIGTTLAHETGFETQLCCSVYILVQSSDRLSTTPKP